MLPVGSQLSGWLPMINAFTRVTVPRLLKMPPPAVAVLPITRLLTSFSAPPTSGIGPGRGTPLAMPPPSPPARLKATTLLMRVRVVGADPGSPWALMIPPPEATRPLPAAALPFTWLLVTVIVPWFTMPPPLVWLAVLLLTWVRFRTATPPFAMPPAAIGGPMVPGGAVAVLPFTWLLFRMRWLVPGGMPPLPFPLWMPPPPALGAVFPVTRLLLRVRKLLVPEKLM